MPDFQQSGERVVSSDIEIGHQIMLEEFWAPLFPPPEVQAELLARYETGLFSPGRPGTLLSGD